jgi:hypothetical protein
MSRSDVDAERSQRNSCAGSATNGWQSLEGRQNRLAERDAQGTFANPARLFQAKKKLV